MGPNMIPTNALIWLVVCHGYLRLKCNARLELIICDEGNTTGMDQICENYKHLINYLINFYQTYRAD